MNATHGRRSPGRIEIRTDDEGLTPHAGLAIVGELARRIGLVGLLDAEIAANRRAVPIKERARGATPGELLTSLAEAQLAGAECFADLEDIRTDDAGGVSGRWRARRFRVGDGGREVEVPAVGPGFAVVAFRGS